MAAKVKNENNLKLVTEKNNYKQPIQQESSSQHPPFEDFHSPGFHLQLAMAAPAQHDPCTQDSETLDI